MGTLYIEAYFLHSNQFLVSIETLIVLFIHQLSDKTNINIILKLLPDAKSETPLQEIDLTNISYIVSSNVPEMTTFCKWPIIVKEQKIIAGVCSVSRQLIKCSSSQETKDLLGFRSACLMACAETSVWTRFCEINMITLSKKVLENKFQYNGTLVIPQEISRFEYHMSQPVKMHNVYKIAREQNVNTIIDTKTPVNKLNINHNFSEGLYITLADAILYPTFKIFFQKYPLDILKEKYPLTLGWYKKVGNIFKEKILFKVDPIESEIKNIVIEDFNRESLYIGDAPSHRTEKRVFTKQSDIENALSMVKTLDNEIINGNIPFGSDEFFSWTEIPLQANPNGGSLPQKRANRKCEQLENLAKAVKNMAGDKRYKIVDFCSGSGHLGILLALYLPNCEIILVENKERSLERAQETISSLNLTNIFIVQSNLDYFHGDFDVGVALHACGVATDLVLKTCIEKRAHFVSCPCCYGGIKNCHQVTYPLSKQFQELNIDKFYFVLAHAADQTHDVDNAKTNQGFLCMDVIDTDRRLFAEYCGYKVHLGKLQPVTCTNKNNLLVGICKDKF